MEIFPAIDIIQGSCVRLTRGDYSRKKKYDDDPTKIALKWKKLGASWLHVVDLDGAEAGRPVNLGLVREIKRLTGLKVQYGGGLREAAVIKEALSTGVDRVILGTRIIEDSGFLDEVLEDFGNSFIPSIDYRKGGKVFTKGWKKSTGKDLIDIINDMSEKGIDKAIITDISRDGTLDGIDLTFIKKVMDKTRIDLIIAGGITDIEDIKALGSIPGSRVRGVVLGKSLYEGSIDLKDALSVGESRDQ